MYTQSVDMNFATQELKWAEDPSYTSESEDIETDAHFPPQLLPIEFQNESFFCQPMNTKYKNSLVAKYIKRENTPSNKNIVKERLTSQIRPEERDAAVYGMFSISVGSSLSHNTFAYATRLFDLLLKMSVITENDINIYAATCLFIATKLEDEGPIDYCELFSSYYGDVTVDSIVSCELRILSTLKFDLEVITPFSYLDLFLPESFNKTTPEHNFTLKSISIACVYSFLLLHTSMNFTSFEISQAVLEISQALMKKEKYISKTECYTKVIESLSMAFDIHGVLRPIFPQLQEYMRF